MREMKYKPLTPLFVLRHMQIHWLCESSIIRKFRRIKRLSRVGNDRGPSQQIFMGLSEF